MGYVLFGYRTGAGTRMAREGNRHGVLREQTILDLSHQMGSVQPSTRQRLPGPSLPLMLNSSLQENLMVLQEADSLYPLLYYCFRESSSCLVDRLHPVNTGTPLILYISVD